jgi:hypothetical protein
MRRLAAREESGVRDWVVLHCLYGEPVQIFLQEVASWLAQNPREFLILDFQHVYQFSGQDHANLVQLILRLFTTRICPCPARKAKAAALIRKGEHTFFFNQSSGSGTVGLPGSGSVIGLESGFVS